MSILQKKITVTADDFGLSENINKAIIELCREGIISKVSVMSNVPDFEKAIFELKESCSNTSYSIHLNLTDGSPILNPKEVSSLLNSKQEFYGGKHYLVATLISLGVMKKIEIEKEWDAQICKAQSCGLNLVELNSHGHLHLHPMLRDVISRLLIRYNIPKVRLIKNTSSLKGKIYELLSFLLKKHLSNQLPNSYSNKITLGVGSEGKLKPESIINKIRQFSSREMEIITHPGLLGCPFHKAWGWEVTSSDYATLKNSSLKSCLAEHND